MIDDVDAWPILLSVAASLRAEITRSGSTLDHLAVYPGQQAALDQNCESQGWVVVTNVYPSQSFPSPASTPEGTCASTLAVTIQVGIMRCAPMPRQVGRGDYIAPPVAEQEKAARVALADMAIMRRAILASTYSDLVLGSYQPQGPTGGLVGGFWTATLGR